MSTKSDSAAAPALPRPIEGLSAIADGYDCFFIDLWGVVHNGVSPFPGVAECLQALKEAGKKTCLLTNAPRRAEGNIERLEGMGIGREAYTRLVSSGEATHFILRDRPEPFHRSLGNRCYHLGPERDSDTPAGLGLDMVASPEEASFVLNTGIDDYSESVADYMPVLTRARVADLPMLCANPDLVVIVGEQEAICAGTLAEAYEEMGGTVGYVGKPHRQVYDFALDRMGLGTDASVLCIGDGFHTDITGAVRAGFDSVFISGGIHGDELDGGSPSSPGMAGLIERYGVSPDYAMRSLVW